MATWTYDEALKRLLADEGGYSNHPSDPGGPTNYGITIFDYRKYINANGTAQDVRTMTVGQAKAIYKSKYWNAQRCDELPPGVDYAVFDYGVNSGIGRSGKVLKRVLGMDASSSVITPEVLAAVKKRPPKAIVDAICDERMRFLQALSTWPTFGVGWGRRVRGVRQAATAMARRNIATAPTPPIVADPTPGRGQVPEPKVVKEAIRTGAPGATAVAGAGFWAWVTAHPRASVVIVLCVLAAVGFGLYQLKAWRDRKQEAETAPTPIVPETAPAGA